MPLKPLWIRLYIQILIFAAMVTLGIVVLWPIQKALNNGMINVRDNLINVLEGKIGRKIKYSSISPSIFGSFDVRNIKIVGEDGHSVLNISRFRVAYSFFDLLRGRAQAIQSIYIDSPAVDLNFIRDKDLIDLLKNLSTGQEDPFSDFFPDKLLLQINNGIFRLYDDKNVYEINAFSLSTEISAGQIILDGSWNSSAIIEMVIGDPVRVGMIMQINGSLSADLNDGSAVFTIPLITQDIRSSHPFSFGMSLKNQEISVWKRKDRLPMDFSLVYGIENNALNLLLGCNNLRLHDSISFHGGLEGASQFLDIAINGNAALTYNNEDEFNYLIDLTGSANGGSTPVNAQSTLVEISAEGDSKNVNIDKIRFSMPKEQASNAFISGDINFSGNIGLEHFSPNGRLSFDSFSIKGNEEINGVINLNTKDEQTNISCDNLNMGKFELCNLMANIKRSANDIDFSVSAQQLINKKETIALNGNYNSEANILKSNLILNSFSLGNIANIALIFSDELPVPSVIMPLFTSSILNAEISLSTDFDNFSYHAPLINISGGAGSGFSSSLSITGTKNEISFTNGEIVWQDEKLKISGNAEYSNPSNLNFNINAGYEDFDYSIEGNLSEGRSVNISGSYGLNFRLFPSDNSDAYSCFMQAENFPLPFLGQPALLSSRLQLNYSSDSAWTMIIDNLEIIDITQASGKAELRFSCRADQQGAKFSDIFYRDSFGPLSGKAEALWAQGFSKLNANVTLAEDTEKYLLDAAWHESLLELNMNSSSARLDRFFGGETRAIADMNIHFTYDMEKTINAEIDIPSIRGKLFDLDYRASAQAKLDSEKLIINAMTINTSEIEGKLPSLIINPSRGIAETTIELNGSFGRRPLKSKMSLNVNFIPVNSWFEIENALKSISGKVLVNELVYGITGEPMSFEAVFSKSDTVNNGAFFVKAGPRDMIRLQMDNDGNFFAGLASPFPVRGTIIGSIKENMINAHCTDFYLDLAEVFKLLPEDRDVDMTGGYVNGFFDIRGSLTDPEFYGMARANSVRMRLPYILTQDIRPIPFNININGNELVLNPVSASIGRGAGTVSGVFQFDRWIPNIFSIDISVPSKTPVPFGIDIVGFTASGNTSGNLIVSMENLMMNVSGDLTINNTRLGYYYNEDVINNAASSFENMFIPIVVDLSVTTGAAVEFLYPSSLIPLIRATLDNGTKIYVTADTMAEQFSVTSDVKIRSGEVFYFERSFYIRSGTMTFRENELRFDPRLTVRADLRDRYENEPVTISMIVENAPLLEFTPRFESSLPLTQAEIFALMGQSFTGTQYDDQTGAIQRAFLSSTSDIFAQFFVVRQLEQQIRNFIRLDMFSVRTQALQNAFFMATGLMQQPVDRIGSVGNYFDNTTIFGGKYIGQDLFIQGMLSMQYDANRTSFGGLTIRPDIGFELQNPLFNIRWDFIPAHPENWYINDNSITLTWRRSF